MTERAYRLVTGILMLSFLFFRMDHAVWALIILMSFEGLTNWRVPIIVSRVIYPDNTVMFSEGENPHYTINYDAERMLRWLLMFMILLGMLSITEGLFWYFPWFIGLMLLLAGVTGICPMVMALRKLGLK